MLPMFKISDNAASFTYDLDRFPIRKYIDFVILPSVQSIFPRFR